MAFRPAVELDYLHSPLRRYVLPRLEGQEISISQITGAGFQPEEPEETFLLTDINNKLDEWQSRETIGHWKSALIHLPPIYMTQPSILVMRETLPDVVWETY